MFFSTRNSTLRVKASEAILKGLSMDGGLFLPAELYSLKADESLLDLSYPELAYKVLRPYLDDFTDEEVREAIASAYDSNHFEEKVMGVSSFGSYSFMELFHGQTLTFKDMALSLLPYLMNTARKKHEGNRKVRILTATSGDTGSAVLSSFSQVPDIEVNILYPDGGIAPIQEKQMLYFTKDNARAYALKDSNFDTCQAFVKSMLVKADKDKGYTSANSINIGRLLPQVVYYYYTYLQLVRNNTIRLNEEIDFVVPTGNFGDIFAGYIAKKMGLPIHRLVIASNENRILTDFFETGVYDLNRDFLKTNSPSMDILISSNLERLLYFVCEDSTQVSLWMNDLKEQKKFTVSKEVLSKLQSEFIGFSGNQEETRNAIVSCYEENHYLLDPHTAVAYHVFKQYQAQAKHHCVIIATASPLKFAGTICESMNWDHRDDLNALDIILHNTKMPLPKALKKVLDCKTPKELLAKEDVEREIFNAHRYTITAPATSANLGPAFDVAGIALSLYNEFSFEKAEKDTLLGFDGIDEKDNMVYSSYKYLFEKFHLPYVPVCIRQLKQDVPFARGLGSSATCIIAGLKGANEVLHHKFSEEEIYQIAIELEGHPDNVAACQFGLIQSNLKDAKGYSHHPFKVNDSLSFIAVIPEQVLKTSDARAALKKEYDLSDVSFNASRVMLLGKAFESGDIALLKEVLQDKVHVPCRSKLIDCYDEVKEIAKDYPFTISGAGSTLLVLTKKGEEKNLTEKLSALKGITVKVLSADSHGATVTKEDI